MHGCFINYSFDAWIFRRLLYVLQFRPVERAPIPPKSFENNSVSLEPTSFTADTQEKATLSP